MNNIFKLGDLTIYLFLEKKYIQAGRNLSCKIIYSKHGIVIEVNDVENKLNFSHLLSTRGTFNSNPQGHKPNSFQPKEKYLTFFFNQNGDKPTLFNQKKMLNFFLTKETRKHFLVFNK